MITDKSSMLETYAGEHADIYQKLEKFVYWLASGNQDPDVPGMEYDDLVQELLVELIKGLHHYATQNLPMTSLIKLLKTMMDHRVSELRYRYYVTHRNLGRYPLTLSFSPDESDEDDAADMIPDDTDIVALCESAERVRQTRLRLSPNALKVLDSVIFGNKRLSMLTAVSAKRSTAIFKRNWANRLRPWHLADALFMPECEVRHALEEIRLTYLKIQE
jgi:DNA-directed RNA polymerase specialized sigma24 family protein